VKKDIKNNILVVGTDADTELRDNTLRVSEIHFLASPRDFPHECQAKIRYRQIDQDCRIEKVDDGYLVTFQEAQRAIVNGQIVAFYDGEELWGSGVIG